MSAKLPTIWMNVTTSSQWRRPPVGIVRVERALSEELAKCYGSRFRQCIWQGARFVEYTPTHAAAGEPPLPPHEKPSQEKRQPELPMIFPILPRHQALVALGQGLLSLTPSRLRPFFNRMLHRIKPHVGRLLASDRIRRLLAKLRRTASSPALAPGGYFLKGVESAFSAGDILISIGLDWDNHCYKQFYALRKHVGVKVVTCCYDVIPVLYPQYCVNDVANFFTSYFLDVADGSDLILCISRQSESDLNNLLHQTGGARPPTWVFPMGDNVPTASAGAVSDAVVNVCQGRFILFVSTMERRKNHEVLYRAYHLLCAQGKAADLPKLVFVGMQGWGVAELMKDMELDPLVQGLIVRLHHVTDAELHQLYESALFCVFPSLYEGWGLPVGEALSMGKAVISSDRGSLPEVGGDAVTYVDPWNAHAWAQEIHKMATDHGYRSGMEARVRRKYRPRQWSESAASVQKAIDSLSHSGSIP